MAIHTLAQAEALRRRRRDVEVEVRFCGGDEERMVRMFGHGFVYRDQGGGDLGERLARATDHALASGCRSAVLIGTDCPTLTVEILTEAFDGLASADVVLGPAADGGYYLIGLRQMHRALFDNIPWGTGDALADTLRAARRADLSTRLLVTLPDVDRPEDLAACPPGVLPG
jgi:rSAM/selenodomain-associated transferase 1